MGDPRRRVNDSRAVRLDEGVSELSMGIDVRIEDEQGRELATVLDPQNLVSQLLPSRQDSARVCLRFVDPYGDTTFNQLQLPDLIADLRHAVSQSSKEAVRLHGEALIQLVRWTEGKVHTYVKFVGD